MAKSAIAMGFDVEMELAQYLPHFSQMSEQLKQTSSQRVS
jgi:hypothetical protein